MPRIALIFNAVVVFSCSLLLAPALRTRRNNATEVDDADLPPAGRHIEYVQHHNASKLLHRTQMLRISNSSRVAERGSKVAGAVRSSAAIRALAKAKLHHRSLPKSWRKALLAIGGGTGVTPVGDTLHGNATHLRRGMDYRARSQTGAVLLLLITSYFVTIGISLNILYKQIENSSNVTFYADPRYHSLSMTGNEFSDFLFTFNQTPKHAFLRVSGLVPLEEDGSSSAAGGGGGGSRQEAEEEVEGTAHRVAFTFALDLSSWIARMPGLAPGGDRPQASEEEGLAPEDLETIAYFLAYDNNDLSALRIQKETEWPGFQELVGNIQQRIRECGFEGVITVSLDGTEVMSVHKNKTWANFMLNRATKAMAAVSVVGMPPYLLYMWWRCRSITVRSRFRIEIPPDEYWPLIADQLGPDGFWATSVAPVVPDSAADEQGDNDELGDISV